MEIGLGQIPAMALLVASKGSHEMPLGVTFLENAEDGQGCSCKYVHPLALEFPDHIKRAIVTSVTQEPQFHWFVFKTFSQVVVYKVDKIKLEKEAAAQSLQAAIRGSKTRRDMQQDE